MTLLELFLRILLNYLEYKKTYKGIIIIIFNNNLMKIRKWNNLVQMYNNLYR